MTLVPLLFLFRFDEFYFSHLYSILNQPLFLNLCLHLLSIKSVHLCSNFMTLINSIIFNLILLALILSYLKMVCNLLNMLQYFLISCPLPLRN